MRKLKKHSREFIRDNKEELIELISTCLTGGNKKLQNDEQFGKLVMQQESSQLRSAAPSDEEPCLTELAVWVILQEAADLARDDYFKCLNTVPPIMVASNEIYLPDDAA